MLNIEKVKKELEKYNYTYQDNVIPGHSVAKVNWILPVGPVMIQSSQTVTSYLFGFTKEGIHIFPVAGDWNIQDSILLSWDIVKEFSMKKGILENTMKIKTNEMDVTMKINKVVAGNPWVKENVKKLEEEKYFRK